MQVNAQPMPSITIAQAFQEPKPNEANVKKNDDQPSTTLKAMDNIRKEGQQPQQQKVVPLKPKSLTETYPITFSLVGAIATLAILKLTADALVDYTPLSAETRQLGDKVENLFSQLNQEMALIDCVAARTDYLRCFFPKFQQMIFKNDTSLQEQICPFKKNEQLLIALESRCNADKIRHKCEAFGLFSSNITNAVTEVCQAVVDLQAERELLGSDLIEAYEDDLS